MWVWSQLLSTPSIQQINASTRTYHTWAAVSNLIYLTSVIHNRAISHQLPGCQVSPLKDHGTDVPRMTARTGRSKIDPVGMRVLQSSVSQRIRIYQATQPLTTLLRKTKWLGTNKPVVILNATIMNHPIQAFLFSAQKSTAVHLVAQGGRAIDLWVWLQFIDVDVC